MRMIKHLLLLHACLTTATLFAISPDRVAITGGAFQFDLSGTGTAPFFAVDADWFVTPHWVVNGSLAAAFPKQQFGERTTFLIPEAQIQYHWSAGRFSPYAGGGVGAALDFRDKKFGGNVAAMTLSTTGGMKIKLTDDFGVLGEMRLRGIGSDFSGSAAEYRFGAFWSF